MFRFRFRRLNAERERIKAETTDGLTPHAFLKICKPKHPGEDDTNINKTDAHGCLWRQATWSPKTRARPG